jgi:ATPase subunit of ABC transporter with duplicated ATPase domains
MSSNAAVALRDVTYVYNSTQQPLFAGLSLHFPIGFTGVVGANGAGKTTLLRLIAGELSPTAGFVQGGDESIYCEQRTDNAPFGLQEFLDDWDGEAFELRGRLGIEPDFLTRWETLSHGERKRAQIACALWRQPFVLAIDEPTNHLDAFARDLLLTSLARFRGVGLIVSHDRDFLDQLCCQCLWLEPPGATLYPGGFTQASDQKQTQRTTALRERDKARSEHKRLQREIVQRREKAASEHAVRSKRGLAPKDSDGREKIDRARVTDSKAGQPLRQLSGKAAQTREALNAALVAKEYETGIWLPGSRSRRNTLVSLAAGDIDLGDNRRLRFPRLDMKPDERIAISGRNGAGKSTLIRHILHKANVPGDKVVYMPQEVDALSAQRLLENARSIPSKQLGQVMNIVSRLGSRPGQLLESRNPSPGEIRKLLLALGMARAPHLIVMDEPTNHLDLPSIEALEAALADCPCGLLLVSHDERFVAPLAATRWALELDELGSADVVVSC